MDRDKISSLYRGPSIDASYQVSVHLAEGFQRRRLKCEKLTNDICQVMTKAHSELKKNANITYIMRRALIVLLKTNLVQNCIKIDNITTKFKY